MTADGAWVAAGDLTAGAAVVNADGDVGTVYAIAFVVDAQVMFNMTVAEAHTYVVGDGEWVVHNACLVPASNIRFSQQTITAYTGNGISLDDLAQSIASVGWQGTPLNVVRRANTLYTLDHRRLAASKIIGIDVPIVEVQLSGKRLNEFLRKSTGLRVNPDVRSLENIEWNKGTFIDVVTDMNRKTGLATNLGIRIHINGSVSLGDITPNWKYIRP